MAELRLDPTSHRWVVTGKRPALSNALDSGDECPFCPGRERFTPKTICERKDDKGSWTVRVFADRAPVFRVEGELDRAGEGMFDRMNAVGAHEVVVESPKHGVTLSHQSPGQIAEVLVVYRDRILDLKRDHRFRYVSVFKRQGQAGPPLEEHGHSQVLATPVVPVTVATECRWSQFHYRRKERCIFCDMVHEELQSSLRMVDQTPDFISVCPYAARFPYELWILPVAHNSAFERDITQDSRLASLAILLKTSLQRIERICERLRLVVHTEPNLAAKGPSEDWWQTIPDDYHWHIEITPELETEPHYLGSEGFYFNPIPAEEAALVLRALEPGPDSVEAPG
jgi:UDPglucose--hexose-1-phosphate uridylyltransferase